MRYWRKLKNSNLFKLAGIFLVISIVSACGQSLKEEATSTNGEETAPLPTPEEYLRAEYWMFEDLGPVPVSPSNRLTEEKVALGKQLFYDKRLSGNNQLSCISCHNPDKGFTDGRSVAKGINDQLGKRNTPSLINVAYYKEFHLDGSVPSLDEQALRPIQNPIEMDQDLDELVKELKAVPEYRTSFKKAFNEEITPKNIAKALGAFERTIIQRNTPFDRFMAGEDDAMTNNQKWGMELFAVKGNCFTCHAGPTFSDNAYDNIAIDNGDVGRYLVTTNRADIGAFRSPQLRDLKYTAPYMHDGSMKTLEEVVEHYDDAIHVDAYTSVDFIPLGLTEEEKKALVDFIENALSGPPIKIDPPKVP